MADFSSKAHIRFQTFCTVSRETGDTAKQHRVGVGCGCHVGQSRYVLCMIRPEARVDEA